MVNRPVLVKVVGRAQVLVAVPRAAVRVLVLVVRDRAYRSAARKIPVRGRRWVVRRLQGFRRLERGPALASARVQAVLVG